MKNSLIIISESWEIKRDEFYEVDPFDKSIDNERKFNDLFCQEDLFWISKSDFNLDLGWYGEEEKGHFGLYLYKGTDWHNCQLLEKRNTNDYRTIIKLINRFIRDVDLARYDSTNIEFRSIDDYSQADIVTLLNE